MPDISRAADECLAPEMNGWFEVTLRNFLPPRANRRRAFRPGARGLRANSFTMSHGPVLARSPRVEEGQSVPEPQ